MLLSNYAPHFLPILLKNFVFGILLLTFSFRCFFKYMIYLLFFYQVQRFA